MLPHFIKPRLLLLGSDDNWLDEQASQFDINGLRTISAKFDEAAFVVLQDLEIEAVLIDARFHGLSKQTVQNLRNAAGIRQIPILLWGDNDNDTIFDTEELGIDLDFPSSSAAAILVGQIEQLIRRSVAIEEKMVRAKTFGLSSENTDDNGDDLALNPLKILSVGHASPDFLALNSLLSKAGAEMTAALSSYSAFDYLHEQSFDAVLLWSGHSPSESLSIASGMRRNAKLYHTPILMRLQSPLLPEIHEGPWLNVNDFSPPEQSPEALSLRIIRLAKNYRQSQSLRLELETLRTAEGMDQETGLFTKTLFARHLTNLSEHAQKAQRPLSLCVLKISHQTTGDSPSQIIPILPQIGSMISRLIRSEDTAGILTPGLFALALPATDINAAKLAAQRLMAVIGCTAFESEMGKPPLVVDFDMGLAQLGQHEQASSCLMRAAEDARLKSELSQKSENRVKA
jgi:two-component system cell cycle response regulator PopA